MARGMLPPSRPMRVRHLLVPLGLALAAAPVLLEREASADTPTTTTTTTIVVNQLVSGAVTRVTGTLGVNKQDCLDDKTLTFTGQITGATTTYSLQVWVGLADCSDIANRTATTAQCHPATGFTSTTTANFSVPVRVRDLVDQLNISPKSVSYQAADANACNAQTTSAAQTLSVYFLLLNGTDIVAYTTYNPNSTGSTTTTTTTTTSPNGVVVDMLGPPAVTGVVAATGDRRARVDWTPSGDSDAHGYVFFCQPKGNAPAVDAGDDADSEGGTTTSAGTCDAAVSSTASDAATPVEAATPVDASDGSVDDGSVDDASVDASVSDAATASVDAGTGTTVVVTDGSCSSGVEVCPAPLIDPSTGCGGVNTKTNSGFTDRVLTNDIDYAIAVAAVDAFGNVGPAVASTVCATPEAVNDFWQIYNSDGGEGGGYCALEAVGMPVGSNAGAIGLAIVGFFAARRRNRRKS